MMKSLKGSRRAIPFLTLALSLFIVVALGTTQALAAWKPTRPIEFIIMAGKGGGADRIARLMQKIVTQNKWSPQPLVPINKKGGSGAEAMLYLLSKKGNPHVILVTLNSFFTTPALRETAGQLHEANAGIPPGHGHVPLVGQPEIGNQEHR